MFKTKNDLLEATRVKVVEVLNARLADCIDLETQTKQAHWNVKGLQFFQVHEMLDTLRDDLDEYNDTMAERVAQLGGTPLGTTQTTIKSSSLPPYPTEISAIEEHLKAMVERTGMVANAVV